MNITLVGSANTLKEIMVSNDSNANPTGGELPKWKAKDRAKMNPEIMAELMKEIAAISPRMAALLLAEPIDEKPKRKSKKHDK